MTLLELHSSFLKLKPGDEHVWLSTGIPFAEADGLIMLCPLCFTANKGEVGTHSVICWRPRVPLSKDLVGPGRWEFEGTGLADLTLVAGSSSIKLMGGCNAHFFVRKGQIEMA
jgi:hypothetical protein